MPVKKFNRSKRKKLSRTQYPIRDYAAKAAIDAAKALSIAYATKKLINVEFKVHDEYQSVNPSDGGTADAYTAVPIGDGPDNRDGYSILPKSLSLHYDIAMNNNATTTALRMVIVQAVSDVTLNVANYFSDVDYLSQRNLDYTNVIKVLKDTTINLDTYHPRRTLTLNFNKFPVTHIQWDQSDTNGSNYKKGQIACIFLSDQATDTPSIACRSRLRYIDN